MILNNCRQVLRLLLVALCAWTATQAVTSVGKWSTCVGKPPVDSFKAPNGEIPSWTNRYNRYGRIKANWFYRQCRAYFAYRSERFDGSGSIKVLRKYGLSETGSDYKWITYREYVYGYKTCNLVKYDVKNSDFICYAKRASLRCSGRTSKVDIVGFCETDGDFYSTYCGTYIRLRGRTLSLDNTLVLCMVSTTRRKLIITSVDPIGTSDISVKPDSVIRDSTINRGSHSQIWEYSATWTDIQTSKYSTEHGWKVGVSSTIESGPLTSAVASVQSTISAEGHGVYVTEKEATIAKQITYVRKFSVPPKVRFDVSITIYKAELTVRYKAKEQFFSKDGKMIGEKNIDGIWTGVTTIKGSTVVEEKKL